MSPDETAAMPMVDQDTTVSLPTVEFIVEQKRALDALAGVRHLAVHQDNIRWGHALDTFVAEYARAHPEIGPRDVIETLLTLAAAVAVVSGMPEPWATVFLKQRMDSEARARGISFP